MEKKIRLLDYANRPKEITIRDFENVKEFVFQILSGDGVLTVIYNDGRREVFDSSELCRFVDFNDGLWCIEPKDIDVLNEMKNHYDTDRLDEIGA